MNDRQTAPPIQGTFPIVLVLAVAQGWALYGLHHAIQSHQWPATEPSSLMALYCALVLVPVTLQLLVDHFYKRSLWTIVGTLGAATLYFGWHYGNAVVDTPSDRFSAGGYFSLAFALIVWWLHALPFVQSRLSAGRWSVDYPLLFRHAWRNIIGLGEAALFTGSFWLILELWQTLFHMLGIDYFRELFGEPIFIYPVTAVAFGCALHLIGSIDRLVSAVLEQLLNVLKWLAIVAGVLLALFTVALVFKLPTLLFTGQRAIGATWLLWLVAVVVLFLNAAYRDGTVDRPYPRAIAQGLRWCVPLLVVVAATAFYALIVRTEAYGLTVGRVWAFVVAAAALIYSTGYAFAAFGKGRWLEAIAQVNIVVALALVATIALTLTPVLSPYRLAANSQYRLVVERHDEPSKARSSNPGPFTYLKFDAGAYGRRKLEQLSNLQNHPDAARIRDLSARALKQATPYDLGPQTDPKSFIAKLPRYPAEHALDATLANQLAADWNRWALSFPFSGGAASGQAAGVFVDLDGDGVEEFVLLSITGGPVYRYRSGRWEYIGQAHPRHPASQPHNAWDEIQAALTDGSITAASPQWRDLAVGTKRFQVDSTQ